MDASPHLPALFPTTSCEVSTWFNQEVHPHELALRAYLRARFPALADPEDIVQEAYVRLLRARETGLLRSPRAMLFTIARNLALDAFRRQNAELVAELANIDVLPVLEPDVVPAGALTHERKLQLLEDALQSLPERCRAVIMMKRFENLSYEEIAARLGISHNTISAHITAGVTKCRDYLRAHGVTQAFP